MRQTYLLIGNSGCFNESNLSFINDYMPWIVALIIGLLSVFVNLFIAYLQSVNNSKIINKQIESTTNLAATNYRRELISINKQKWINEITEIVAKIDSQFLELTFIISEDKLNKIYEINGYICRLEILLDETIENQSDLKTTLKKLFGEISIEGAKIKPDFYRKMRKSYLEKARDVIKSEWKNLQNIT